jgi:hypothetical protein
MPIRRLERHGVFTRRSRDGKESGTNEGIEHGEFQLEVLQARVRLP